MLQFLKSRGLKNPHRIKTLLHKAISDMELDLEGLTIFTEAASKNYVVTPIIAAMARAKKVYAVTTDSEYGSAKDIAEFTYRFAEFCQVKNIIEVVFEKKREIVNQADIITNIGFVRPINTELVRMMKEEAVIPLMCEAWELRRGDIDLNACRERNIPVIATNEDYPNLAVFDYSGHLCMKMLFEMEIEIFKSKIVIISGDKFGAVIEKYLRAAGAKTKTFRSLKEEECLDFLVDADALIVADYLNTEIIIGNNGQLTVPELQDIAPGISVIQFSGISESGELAKADILCFPPRKAAHHKMGLTFSYLGPKPVIELHTAGLKVGELMVRARRHSVDENIPDDELSSLARWSGLAVPIIDKHQ